MKKNVLALVITAAAVVIVAIIWSAGSGKQPPQALQPEALPTNGLVANPPAEIPTSPEPIAPTSDKGEAGDVPVGAEVSGEPAEPTSVETETPIPALTPSTAPIDANKDVSIPPSEGQ